MQDADLWRAARLWIIGMDTLDIAEALLKPEATIWRYLSNIRTRAASLKIVTEPARAHRLR